MIGATRFAVAAAIVALFGGFLVADMMVQQGVDSPEGSVGAPAVASPTPSPTDRFVQDSHPLTVDGIDLSFHHGPGWEGLDALKDDLYISRSVVGPQGAEVMILWTTFPDSQHARPCLLDLPAGASGADLAAAVATAPGTQLVSGPSDVMVGGRPAKQVVLTVVSQWDEEGMPSDWEPGCDPAYFFGWEPHDSGAFWLETVPGDTIRVGIVDVGGKLLFIEAETVADAGAPTEGRIEALPVDAWIQDIVDSIRFE